MARSLTVIAVVFVIVITGACAAKKPRPQPTVYFSTSITQDGGKFFVYSLVIPERTENDGGRRPSQGTKGDGRPGGRRGGPEEGGNTERRNRNQDSLKGKVDRVIAENRYCRDGYIVLDQHTGAGMVSLRGECQDGATPEDRTRFRNPV